MRAMQITRPPDEVTNPRRMQKSTVSRPFTASQSTRRSGSLTTSAVRRQPHEERQRCSSLKSQTGHQRRRTPQRSVLSCRSQMSGDSSVLLLASGASNYTNSLAKKSILYRNSNKRNAVIPLSLRRANSSNQKVKSYMEGKVHINPMMLPLKNLMSSSGGTQSATARQANSTYRNVITTQSFDNRKKAQSVKSKEPPFHTEAKTPTERKVLMDATDHDSIYVQAP